jgi:hypothetical protein
VVEDVMEDAVAVVVVVTDVLGGVDEDILVQLQRHAQHPYFFHPQTRLKL